MVDNLNKVVFWLTEELLLKKVQVTMADRTISLHMKTSEGETSSYEV